MVEKKIGICNECHEKKEVGKDHLCDLCHSRVQKRNWFRKRYREGVPGQECKICGGKVYIQGLCYSHYRKKIEKKKNSKLKKISISGKKEDLELLKEKQVIEKQPKESQKLKDNFLKLRMELLKSRHENQKLRREIQAIRRQIEKEKEIERIAREESTELTSLNPEQ